MKNKNNISLTRERRHEMVEAIQNYFDKERDEELGNLAAGLMLDFIIEELAGEFYNQGVQDSYKFMSDKCEDLLTLQK